MRYSHTCPKCSGKKFAVNAQVRVPEYHTSNVTGPIPGLTLCDVSAPGTEGRCQDGRQVVGWIEAWICLRCGYTEHYTYGLGNDEQLAQLVAQYPQLLRIVDASAAPAPQP
jgi:predicted nucleic-acid-binding Zn-ribbon protein